ncbi:acetate/propionate family kinase [Hoeflea sp. WL0058]|uniref:Acetate kinase n=1 Tax=Flavimaribacter sediminis TaxID=2865987 RepID=A0AAE3D486_9HYPH|nr:acetate/propionate family kinase [Flavimaribacter sediminis]MBW8640568.1 acetate/propionate family kinase [Flavimaribacter sediminis]
MHLLTLNCGSSSIKFAIFDSDVREVLRGQIDGIGTAPRISAKRSAETVIDRHLEDANVSDHGAALSAILDLLRTEFPDISIASVGHRIVHGGTQFSQPVVLDKETMVKLRALIPLAPLHQPNNLAGVDAAAEAFPDAVQVGCFDTAFHRDQPWINDAFALPYRYYEEGVRRYGFHGLSYEYVSGRLREISPAHASGRVVACHLGNGASMCAIDNGRSIGSTMGFTALDGLPMGTRCGQLDPGVVLYLMQEKGMSAHAIEDMLYHDSGLKGLSGLSNDLRTLEAAATPEADRAIDYFTGRIRIELGALAAMLGGLDAVIFCGGIGENAWRIRKSVCEGFEWMGVEFDARRNRSGDAVISTDQSSVGLFVIQTDEEIIIARHALELIRQ